MPIRLRGGSLRSDSVSTTHYTTTPDVTTAALEPGTGRPIEQPTRYATDRARPEGTIFSRTWALNSATVHPSYMRVNLLPSAPIREI